MKIGEAIYFNNKKTMTDMENCKPDEWLEEWKIRIIEHYFQPARLLNENRHGFSALLLTCSGIEAISTIVSKEKKGSDADRFNYVFEVISQDFPIKDVNFLYKYYRNGLVHNGKTIQSKFTNPDIYSCINYEGPSSVEVRAGILIEVNPKLLLEKIISAFEKFIASNQGLGLGESIREIFIREIEYIKKLERV